MRISVQLVWYNGMGGHPAISFAGEFLLLGSPNTFGETFDTIECYPHIPSEHWTPGLEVLSSRFDERTRKLPKSWIKRKLRRIEVSYNSLVGTQEELFGEKRPVLSVPQFSLVCHEIESALDIIENKISDKDSFQLAELRAHFRNRLQQLPRTEIELQTVIQQLRLEQSKRLLP